MPDVTFPSSDGDLRGYVATPAGAGPWPGVVVIHEAFGLTDDIRAQADRFAADGYLAIAPDLYSWGATARCLIATVRTMMSGSGRALADVQAARSYLASRDDCTGRIGVIGFCMGGALAVLVSPEGFDVAAPNYGEVPNDATERLRGACPMVASYGGKDRTLKGRAQRLEAALTALGIEHDVEEYAAATHGFLFEHTGKTRFTSPWLVKFEPESAADAWRRIFAFFGKHLKETSA